MDDKWRWIAIIVAIIMIGMYQITDLYFDRIDQIQKNSQQVIER